MGDGNGEKKVKVVDRRWLTPEGDIREQSEVPAPPASPSAGIREPQAAPDSAAPDPARTEPPRESQMDAEAPPEERPRLSLSSGFLDLVDVLAQQAMVLLSGQVPGRGRDAEAGRVFVDLLGVLKEKTTGNLTLEETNYLEDVLYQLHSLYVAATR